MRRLLVVLIALGCAPTPADPPASPADAPEADAPPEIRWHYTGPLQETVAFSMEVAPESGALTVELTAALEVSTGPEPGLLTIDYRITEVQALEMTGVLALGPTVDERRASLLALSHRFVVDEKGVFQPGSEPLTDAEHEQLGPGLHAVDQFLTLPLVPEYDASKYTLEIDGDRARLSGRDVQDAEDSYGGVTAQIHSETDWSIEADLQTGRPLEREVESTAVARYADGAEETHHGHAKLRFTTPK